MRVHIEPGNSGGRVMAIPSKSSVHRMLITACLEGGNRDVQLNYLSSDMEATMECLEELGFCFTQKKGRVSVSRGQAPEIPELCVRDSGSTFRFLLPVACSLFDQVHFSAWGRLSERPVRELMEVMEEGGVSFSSPKPPFSTRGRFRFRDATIRADISSQYLSGLLFASVLQEVGATLHWEGPMCSKRYFEMTIAVLEEAGFQFERGETRIRYMGYNRREGLLVPEGDWSNAAFFLVLSALGHPVSVGGLRPGYQADAVLLDILEEAGSQVEKGESILVKGRPVRGVKRSLANCPDLFPILAILLSQAGGDSLLTDTERLREKESDRIVAMQSMFQNLGMTLEVEDNRIRIPGNQPLKGGEVDSFSDHRIAMAGAIAGALSEEGVTVSGMEAMEKSYPTFLEDLEKAGVVWHQVSEEV